MPMCLRYIVEEKGADMTDGISRRKFMTSVAATGAGLTIVPRHVLGRGFQAPSDTVNIATVGIGGMGGSNTRALMSQNIVAVCDVDWGYAEKRFDAYKAELSRIQSGTTQNQQSQRPRPTLSKARLKIGCGSVAYGVVAVPPWSVKR